MNISMRDKKLLLMFSGVAVFGLGWFFGYRPQMEEAANIEAANKPLEERLSNLLELAGNRDFYISETESAQNKINEYVAKFPSDVKEENGIVLAQNIENSLGIAVSNVRNCDKRVCSLQIRRKYRRRDRGAECDNVRAGKRTDT